MKLSVVIPVFNEVATFNEILARVENSPVFNDNEKEIIIVDDCSTDGTRDLLKKIHKNHVKVFLHEKNRGKGAALRTGFAECTGDIVIVQDADTEYDPNEYARLVAPIVEGKADVVYGSRFRGEGPHRILYFWHRVANLILTLFSNMFSDLNLTDMETCYKVFRRDVLTKINLEEDRFGIEPEMTAKIAELSRKEGIHIYEMGISYYGRTYEDGKKIGLKDAFRAFWCVYKYNTSHFACFIKYACNGIIVGLSQLIAILFLIEVLGFKSYLMKNIANGISIEVSIITGFIIHSSLTWRYAFKSFNHAFRSFWMFQLISSVSLLLRVILFAVLLTAGVHYLPNVLIGMLVAIMLNFFGYKNIVFKSIK